MLELILMLSVRIIVGVLFLIAGVITYYILRGKRLPVLVSIGALIYGMWSTALALVNAYIMFLAMGGENLHVRITYIALLNKFLSWVSIIILLLFAILFIVGIHEIAKRIRQPQTSNLPLISALPLHSV